MENNEEECIKDDVNELKQIRVFQEGIAKLAQFRKISIIALCDNGDVAYAKQIETDRDVSIKRVHKCLIQNESKAIELCKRLKWEKSLNHPFILAIEDIFQDERTISIISEFCPCGNLFSYLQTYSYLPELQVKFIAIQVIDAIQYLHKNKCIFCGLLAENVLVTRDGYIKLTGFSQSLIDTSIPYYGITGYLEYLSPEMLLNKGIDYSYDWYQLGCLLFELIEGRLPFESSTTTSILQKILLSKLEFTRASFEAQKFITSLLNPDPEKRLGFKENDLKNHEWFKDITWKNVVNKAVPSQLIRVPTSDGPDCYFPHFKEDILEGDNPEVFNSVFAECSF